MVIRPILPQVYIIGPVVFYTYGFMIGLSLFFGLWLVERKVKSLHLNLTYFFQLVGVVLLTGLIGARMWHLVTDWQSYIGHWQQSFNLTHGGLSILGAVAGGVLGLGGFNYRQTKFLRKVEINNLTFLDLAVFGLPLGQAIGRFGNYVNQELYGLPSRGLVKLYIDQNHRLPGYMQVAYYHPLFLYEMIGLILLAVLIYWLNQNQSHFFRVGKGRLFLIYLIGYSWLRFGLEFLRLQKTMLSIAHFNWLGVNQLILFLIACFASGYLFIIWQKYLQKKG